MDRISARIRPLGFVIRVQQRYNEANGRASANSITLDGFLALFAMLVLAAAVLGYFSQNDHDFAHHVVNALGVKGSAEKLIVDAVDTARRSRRVATVAGIFALLVTGSGFAVA